MFFKKQKINSKVFKRRTIIYKDIYYNPNRKIKYDYSKVKYNKEFIDIITKLPKNIIL